MTASAICDLVICAFIIIGLFWVMHEERKD